MNPEQEDEMNLQLHLRLKYKNINLEDGDSLTILPETKEFMFGCCNCKLVHKIKVKRKDNNILLQFFRLNSKDHLVKEE